MKNFIRNALGLLATIPALAKASPDIQFNEINGYYHTSNKVISENIKINGEANIGEGSIINAIIVINGTLKAENSEFAKEVFANGISTVKNSKFEDEVYFSGNLSTESTSFIKSVSLLSSKATFSNCKISNLTIQSIAFGGKQIIYLNKGTVVSGDVKFESGNGQIYLDKSSLIIGSIIGAEITAI